MVALTFLTAFLITPVGMILLGTAAAKTPSVRRKLVPFIGLMFGIIGYCSIPLREIDISRYFAQLDYIRKLPVRRSFNWANDGLVIKNVVFWLISKMNDNNLLPFFSLFTIYSIMSYIVVDISDERTYEAALLLLLQIMLIPFYNTFSNVRNVTCFAILSYAAYRDLYHKKRDILTILLYIIPCYIHMAGFVVVLIRLLIPLIAKMSYIGTAVTFSIPTVFLGLYDRLRNITLPGQIGKIISRGIWKAYASLVRTSDYAQEMQTHGSFVANRLLAIAFCVAVFVLIIKYQNKYRTENKEKHQYSVFVEVITIISFIFSVLGVVKYWIFMFLLYLCFIPVFVEFVRGDTHRRDITFYSVVVIIAVAIARFILQTRSVFLNLETTDFLLRLTKTNYVVILFRIMKGIFV